MAFFYCYRQPEMHVKLSCSHRKHNITFRTRGEIVAIYFSNVIVKTVHSRSHPPCETPRGKEACLHPFIFLSVSRSAHFNSNPSLWCLMCRVKRDRRLEGDKWQTCLPILCRTFQFASTLFLSLSSPAALFSPTTDDEHKRIFNWNLHFSSTSPAYTQTPVTLKIECVFYIWRQVGGFKWHFKYIHHPWEWVVLIQPSKLKPFPFISSDHIPNYVEKIWYALCI